MTAAGFASRTSRIASGKRSRSSSAPSCLPAIENGGQGTPPATRSTPEYFFPFISRTSPSCTSQSGRLRRSVAAACLSISTARACSKPACSSPNDCPPAPAQISRTESFDDKVLAVLHVCVVTVHTIADAHDMPCRHLYAPTHSASKRESRIIGDHREAWLLASTAPTSPHQPPAPHPRPTRTRARRHGYPR